MEYSSPIGALTLISDSEALLSLEFEQKRYPFSLPERCQLTVLPDYSGNREGGEGQGSCQDGAGSGRSQVFPAPLLQAARWLDCYFQAEVLIFCLLSNLREALSAAGFGKNC